MKIFLLILILQAGLLCGCKKDSASEPASTTPTEKKPSGISLTAPSQAPAAAALPPTTVQVKAATAGAPANKPGEKDEDGADIGLKTLNEALQEFLENVDRPPNSLNELVQKRYLRTLPVPPPGKQYYYDKDAKMIGIK